MTGARLLSDDIEREIPSRFAGASVVALVPATELRGWAAEMAWRVARAAATVGRRTVLVDCFVDAPTLHDVAGESNAEGIVDAFEYGASLNRIVQEQPQADLFFIPAGTYTADAEPVMRHPRWRRLSAGFRHEEALLLLYVGAEHLATLAAEPDGMVVLAPQGPDLTVADHPALMEAVAKGLPLLAVVADEHAVARASGARTAPAAEASAADGPPAGDRARATPLLPQATATGGARRTRPALVAALVLGAVAIAAALRFGALDLVMRPRETVAPAPAPHPGSESARPSPPPAPLPPVASLPFAVQVAALPRLPEAFAMADSLEAHGMHTMLAPVRLRGRDAFYRVYAGPYATRATADSALAAMRSGGYLARGTGTTLSVPLSVALAGHPTRAAAAVERARLRAQGVPAFVLGQADGTFRLFAGAYDATAQASVLQDLLTPTGSAGEFVPRAGYVP